MNSFENLLSQRVKSMQKSAIRELLKLTQKNDIISFAGGMPAPELFPAEDIDFCSHKVLQNSAAKALQYGTTEGDLNLRKQLAIRHNIDDGLNIDENNIVVVTGSQQGLDLLGRIFIDKGDVVMCGLPSYLGGLNAFSGYGAELRGVALDDNGLSASLLDKEIEKVIAEGKKPKFIYTIPDFQNPTGITMSKQRRLEILNVAYKYSLPIVEDCPYRQIRFEGETQPMFQQLDTKGLVISLGTLSKVLSPGFRIGWIVANPLFLDKFVTAKQSTDLCTSPFVQMVAAEYFEQKFYDKNIGNIAAKYKEKRDAMLEALDKYMPKEISWTRPEGGLFLFLNLPKHIDSNDLFHKAIENDVAFVVGNVFYCNGEGRNTMRLNFSFPSLENNVEGVKRLGNAIREML